MELLKQSIRMNCPEREGQVQFTLEEDFNLPETKPDVGEICFEKGCVMTEEVIAMENAALVKGKLAFSILYHTRENGGALERVEGRIPFEEKVRAEGLTEGEDVFATGVVDDLSVTMINSRKLNIQSVVTLTATQNGMREEALPVGIQEPLGRKEYAQVRQSAVDFTQVQLCKRDVFRIKEEITLPTGYPNVGRILWKDVSLGEMNFRLGEENLFIQGEARIFVLYESEGDGMPQVYETVINASAQVDCPGCREGEALDVRYDLAQWDLQPKPDPDGEQRELGLEATVDLKICVYAQEHLGVVKDIYGVTKEICGKPRSVRLRQLLRGVTGKTKVSGQGKREGGEQVSQLVYGDGTVSLTEAETKEGGMTIRGMLGVKILYGTGDEDQPYGCLRTVLPFEYSLEVPGMTQEDVPERLKARVEQISITMPDGEEVEIRAILSIAVSVFRDVEVQVIDEISEEEQDREKMAALPSMVAYVVQEGEDLWTIGKKYYVPVQSLIELNELNGEEVTPGQKLLILKEWGTRREKQDIS